MKRLRSEKGAVVLSMLFGAVLSWVVLLGIASNEASKAKECRQQLENVEVVEVEVAE